MITKKYSTAFFIADVTALSILSDVFYKDIALFLLALQNVRFIKNMHFSEYDDFMIDNHVIFFRDIALLLLLCFRCFAACL